ncbi:hypothetical protein QYM36_011270 [Artemia franciscana]|uniref:Uncharacterized protein n=1 Tax=Artemia franciscana TaxID=6661 RepID=A0AA88HLJ1_ARTSF|nr:hypothetical protein QYM36_011270 [Artemia franciscana]
MHFLILLLIRTEFSLVSASSCRYTGNTETEQICHSVNEGAVELLKVEEHNPDSVWFRENYTSYKIKVEEVFSPPPFGYLTLDDIVWIDGKTYLSNSMDLTVGNSYAATTLIGYNNTGHAARKLRYCITWHQKWNNLSDEQRKYLHDVRNNCRKGISFSKAEVTFSSSGATGVTRVDIFVAAVAAMVVAVIFMT